MKKAIIAVVILGAALVGLKFFSAKQQVAAPKPAQTAAQQEQQGVALPSGAKDVPAVNTESVYVPTQAMGSYDNFNLPANVSAVKGACEGGSPKEIMDAHGKTWGYFAGRRIALDNKKSQIIYDYVGDYYACLAASRQEFSVCNELPGEAEKDGIKTDVEHSPLGYCRNKAGLFLFKAYIAGKTKDQQNCMAYLSDWDSSNLSKIVPGEFCAAAGGGPEKIMAYVKEKMPAMAENAERMLGFSRSKCGSDPVCLASNGVWEGIRTGDAGKCPSQFSPHCGALAQKSAVPCVTILNEMSSRYCGFYKELLKAGGGYAGVTAEEVKEDLRAIAQKKAEEERQRKELDANTKQINERVKKLIGGKGGD